MSEQAFSWMVFAAGVIALVWTVARDVIRDRK